MSRIDIAQLQQDQSCVRYQGRDPITGRTKFYKHSIWGYNRFYEFGLGVRLYYEGLLQLAGMFFLMGLVSLPQTAISFSWNWIDPSRVTPGPLCV